MAENDLLWKYCNLQKREAAFTISPESSVEDNLRISDSERLQCLDMLDSCYDLGCKFALGKIDPFVIE